ncbi:YtxH domain-containing protein [Lacticaseibacillus jixiensis]|uniref:YtxH domain-containing protein n=1 Tax=Lacticaseibacillus jixiensis TaxID=3231926 RepID=UPI0036F4387D
MANKGHFFLGFILGATSALATTYLLTPQTSDELRRKFSAKKDDLADRAADYYDYAKDATADWRESAGDLVENLKEKVRPASADLASYDADTQALKDELTQAPEVATDSDFDDIVLDGKSAFAQAKDSADADTDAPAEPTAAAAEAPAADPAASDEAASGPTTPDAE